MSMDALDQIKDSGMGLAGMEGSSVDPANIPKPIGTDRDILRGLCCSVNTRSTRQIGDLPALVSVLKWDGVSMSVHPIAETTLDLEEASSGASSGVL